VKGEAFQRHSRSILLLTVLLAAAGVWAALSLPVSLFPDIQFPRIVVSVNAGDRPVDRMAIEVTQPLERALRSVPNVVDIRSTSSRGSGDISVNFNWGTDMITALLQAESAVNNLLPTLPPGTTFTARRLNPTVFPMLGLALTSKTRDPVSLRDFAYYQLRRKLSTISGIARIEALGGQQEEYEVLLNPARLRGLGMSIDDVARTLSASNVVNAVGRLEDRSRLYLIVSSAPMKTLADIRGTIVRSGSDGIVTLEDVAEVKSGVVPNWTTVAANGRKAVLLNVYQQPGADTVAIVKNVKAAIAQANIPTDITIKPYYDQSELVVSSEHSVRDAIAIGAAFAALILFLFLKNWRVTLIIAAMLPIVLTATVLVLHVLHMSFNMMTLGGMAAAVGLIIDDGVVMLEHIARRLQGASGEGGGDPGGVVVKATLEMARPLISSSLATTVIFLPLAFLGGVSGGFFKALALTMASALFISFFAAFFAVPLLARFLLAGHQKEHQQKVMDWAGKRYEWVMTRFLKRPLWVIPLLLVLGVAGYFAFTAVGTGFLPKMDEGGFVLDYRAAPGTSLSDTDRLLRQVDKIIENTPEVDSYSRRTGLQLGGGVTEANSGDIFIHLKAQRSRSIFAVMDSVRARVEQQVPGLDIELSQLIEDVIGDLTAVPQPIEIKIFSSDPQLLHDLPPKVAKAIRKVNGVVGVNDGIVIAGDSIDIEINRVNAALEGMDPQTITTQIQDQLGGTVASQIPAQEKIIGVRVRIPGDLRTRIAQVQELPLRAPDGHILPLKRVAKVHIVTGQAQIDRENERTLVAVTARIVGRSLGVTVQDVKAAVKKMNLPSGVTIEYGGLYQQQQKSSHDLTIVFASAVMLVAVLLLFVYERFAVVVSILVTSLLTLIGVFAGLWITGTTRNITSMMGMTMIIGMVTEIAIFYFAELDVSKRPDSKELIAAGVGRMRAILMSALIAILSLMPLALTLGSGSGMLKPLAIAIISGLVVAVPLVLLLMPAMYAAISRHGRSPE
jgi:CzcA family heavy metal efflux pump